MFIVMQRQATPEQVKTVRDDIQRIGFRPFINPGVERKVIAVLGELDAKKAALLEHFYSFPGVERVDLISHLWKLASREYHPSDSVFDIAGIKIGGEAIAVIAGPCSVESEAQIIEVAEKVKAEGAQFLRGGAFKPRTSPYAFQGLGEDGLKFLAKAGEVTGLPIVTEVMDTADVELVAKYADVLQIGTRNMQNYSLLKRVGQTGKPVILKRGQGCKIRDLIMSAEYMMAEGNEKVILCERGITTFEDSTRNTTDINAIPVLKHWTHLPIILDPSHATGDWRYVASVSRAAVAAGADGLLIEVHNNPKHALCDGAQSLRPEQFKDLMEQLSRVSQAVGRIL
jgi:3-deoxy-7-phosphoheptulonate synthase